uniref:Transcription termination factor 2 n=1 Tax=Amphimedon queenslandica TaxID=400682 RepID=A0A1X7TXG7_AMPQE
MDSSVSSKASVSTFDSAISALDATAASTDLESHDDDSIVRPRRVGRSSVMIEESASEDEEESDETEGDTTRNEEDGETDEEGSLEKERQHPEPSESEENNSDVVVVVLSTDEDEELSGSHPKGQYHEASESEENNSDSHSDEDDDSSDRDDSDSKGRYCEPSESEENNSDSHSNEDDDSSDRDNSNSKGRYREPSQSEENNSDSGPDQSHSDEDNESSYNDAKTSEPPQPLSSLVHKLTLSSSHKEAARKPVAIYHPPLHGPRPTPPTTSTPTISAKSGLTSANKENEGDEDEKEKEKGFEVGFQFRKLVKQLYEQQTLFDRFGAHLPDNGSSIKMNIESIKKRMIHLRGYVPSSGEIIEMLRQPEDPKQSAVASSHSGQSTNVAQPGLRKGLMVHAQAKFLSANVVSSLHNTISSRPTEDTPTDPPRGLKVPLMAHQKTALTFLLWREKQVPRGGILADDMGLGKTLSMISLIMKKKQLEEAESEPQSTGESRGRPTLRTEATLVVAPLTLLSIWENEIESKLYSGNLSVFRYHGPKRPKDPRVLIDYDVVITTYDIIGMEGNAINAATDTSGKAKRSAHPTLFHIHWKRIILDEAHIIRNPKSATSEGCCSLDADYRWALTGTPIQNKLKDFYSLIKFLHVAPFDDLRVWKDTIEGRNLGMKRLQAMVSCLVLRRLKEEFESTKLPAKNVVCHKLALNPEERSIYNVLFHFSRDFFMKYLTELGEFDMLPDSAPSLSSLLHKVPSHLRSSVETLMESMIPNIEEMEGQRRSGSMILLLLLRLRQCCNHPNLLSTALTSEVLAEDDLALAMGALSIGATSEPKQDLSVSSKGFFHSSHISSKVQSIITKLDEIFSNEDPNEPLPNKCIIVSQWTSMLHIIEHHLTLSNISCTKIDGKVPLKDRHANIDAFNRKSPNPRVMLLSLQAGGVGLTLTAANHVFITDLHWNPQLEQQASDRCHRVGQTRTVTIHRFMTENTVERVIAVIQENKLKLASDVLGGSTKKGRKGMGLTLHDLKMLFEIP